MNVYTIFFRVYFIITQFGIDLVRMLCALQNLPRYLHDLWVFLHQKKHGQRIRILPCLHDYSEEAGAIRHEYFWQDLLVARKIAETKPEKHVDIGSRLDGFIAHIASFREIEVFDIRPLSCKVPGVTFRQLDLMNLLDDMMKDYCDSLSCLHALEHFGLGRYGDEINPEGYKRGLENMANLLRNGGILYLSVPIGIERVEFNAHRIFDPCFILNLATLNSLQLLNLIVITGGENIKEFHPDEVPWESLAKQPYSLGIFIFIKNADLRKSKCYAEKSKK